MKVGSIYKLDNEYLKCFKVRKNGVNTYQVCNKDGVIKPPVRAKNGFITDHGVRIVSKRINELIEV